MGGKARRQALRREILISFILLVSIHPIDCQQENRSGFEARIKTTEGQAFEVKTFKRDARFTDLVLDMGGYNLAFPFEIIKRVSFNFNMEREIGDRLRAEVLFGDGSVAKGSTWGSFVRQTDLGETKIDFINISEIEFSHTPSEKYAFKPRGKHSLMLQIGDSRRTIKGASFVDDFDENAPLYYDYFFFEIKGNSEPIQVYWNKIKYLMPANPNYRGTDEYVPTKITTMKNTDYVGRCSLSSGMAQTIEGSIRYSANYELRIRIHIPDIDDEHPISKIEF
jgi:hypothetical protein